MSYNTSPARPFHRPAPPLPYPRGVYSGALTTRDTGLQSNQYVVVYQRSSQRVLAGHVGFQMMRLHGEWYFDLYYTLRGALVREMVKVSEVIERPERQALAS